MAARVPVTFVPADVTVWVSVGSTVLAAARSAGILITAPCGGRGICGSCGVRVVEGSLEPPDDAERVGLSRAPEGVRLACRARVSCAVTVRPLVHQLAPSTGGARGAGSNGTLVAGVDLGTTTVSAVIISSASGRELGRATVPNAQANWGADVLSRLSAAISGAGGELRMAAERGVLQALEAACGHAGACLGEVRSIVVAGNTAMSALFAGVNPSALATAPFAIPDGILAPVSGLLASALPNARIDLVEPVAAFVGGDAAAGLLAAGMLSSGDSGPRPPHVLVDLGTNAEILVTSALGLTVGSAPAGPAFEGFGIAYGGTWGTGAVEDVAFDGAAFTVGVAGGGEAGWLCGSGLVSAIAALRAAGHIAPDGLMLREGPLSDRFLELDGVLACSLARDGEGSPYLLQTDIRAFQMAKSAVASALEAVVAGSRTKPASIGRLFVSGGFGSVLDAAQLVQLGVLPEELADRVEVLGNTALLGAAMLAFDPGLAEAVKADVAGAVHVELATDDAFRTAFMEHLALEPFRLDRTR